MIYLLLFVNFLFAFSSFAQVFNPIQFSECSISEIQLKNGLKVILKVTDFEPNEVYFRLVANGGYASLPAAQCVSGKFAASIAWESGIGGLSSDQISALLYKHSIEFTPQILPFNRCVEGNFDKAEMEVLFKLLNWFFTKHKITQEAFDAVLKKEQENLQKNLSTSPKIAIDKAIHALNIPYLYDAKSLSAKDLELANFDFTGSYFEEAFSNPTEFTLILVGDLEPEKINPLLQEWIGTIPVPASIHKRHFVDKPIMRSFPIGITSKEVSIEEKAGSLVHLTFPLTAALNEETMVNLELASRLIQDHLRNSLQHKLQNRCDLEASLVLPFHPCLDSPWLTIRCRYSQKGIDFLKKTILQELQSFQKSRIPSEEIMKALEQLKEQETSWMKENDFWLVTLSNYSLWKWDLQKIFDHSEKIESRIVKNVQEIIHKKLNLETYTVFSVNP